ncbi:F-box/FBD/LRR-repeat protein At5g56420-like [Silene latifolia]|uniref:F-box/FBD/LRR-repeat protein At5g56420-like n=1 Tax=Silene latifolia TaxID=37657 RepID=UPI003D76E72C
MKSMSNKSGSCESNDGIEDRLSGLPDEVIVHILSLMPTLDAVKTMLLRRFGDLWTLVPTLRFDFYEYSYEMIRTKHKPPSSHKMFSSFGRLVRNVQRLYRRSVIDSFYLSIDDNQEELKDVIGDVHLWLRFAIDKQVKDLYFDCANYRNGPCPPHLFTSQSLAVLTLSHCTLNLLEHESQPHLGTLRKLSLIQVTGTTNAYDKLFRGCPSLQELYIDMDGAPGLLSLNINAPSVSKLYLHLFHCYCTLNCPSLKILDIGVYGATPPFLLGVIGSISLQEVNVKSLPRRCSSGLVKSFFQLIQNAKIFMLSSDAFEEISSIKKMEFPQNRWKRIVLHPLWNCERCHEVICMLIKSSINLEELIICAGESPGTKCELVCPKFYTCVLPLLKTVTIYGNHGYQKWCKGQLQVIKFLLANAVVLDKLVITLGKSKLTTIEELDLVKQVSTFKRASAYATIIFA